MSGIRLTNNSDKADKELWVRLGETISDKR